MLKIGNIDIKALHLGDTEIKRAYVGNDLVFSAGPKANVFGVMWNYANSSTSLTRLTKATDPNQLVTQTVSATPVPAVGLGNGSSPFDQFAPWSGVQEYNIVNGSAVYKKGDSGFSRTLYDTMVYIPKFWYRCVDDSANKKRYWYISDIAVDGMEEHPGSGKYVSRYTVNSAYNSVSNSPPAASITRAAARASIKQKGAGWSLYNILAMSALQILYLVEFADWNCQAKIGRGYTDGNAAILNSGATDSMVYHTGRAEGTNGKTAVQYRGVEHPWGNLYQYVDGINILNRVVYISKDQSKFADDTSDGYINTGITLPADGYCKNFGYVPSDTWLFIPNESGGTENTYIPDYIYGNPGWRSICVGGDNGVGSMCGLFYMSGYSDSAWLAYNLGARSVYDPEVN